jgi:hypothetical protein
VPTVVDDPYLDLDHQSATSRIQKEITHIHIERYTGRVTADKIQEIQFEITYTFSEWGVSSFFILPILGNRHRREPEAIYLTSWDSTDSVSFKSHLEVASQVPHGILGYIAIR